MITMHEYAHVEHHHRAAPAGIAAGTGGVVLGLAAGAALGWGDLPTIVMAGVLACVPAWIRGR
ncbi:hypothetical protein [Nonomuraea sediminis]|uniref:hypothetical protein n=1 Tax=Nonomuraea sediminis TaxID=2835864 RepID=UPI001BDC7A23|nr:hypothetical protein [Nonomuraea sediminis]